MRKIFETGMSNELMKMVYQDALQPGVRHVGHAIGNIAEFCVLPTLVMKYGSEAGKLIFKRNMCRLAGKLESIPEENIVSPPIELGTDLMDHLTKVQDDNLAELFVSLLANSCNIEKQKKTHPRFASILKQISSDEAKMINELKRTGTASAIYTSCYLRASGKVVHNINHTIPKVLTSKLVFPTAGDIYIENLGNLGIFLLEQNGFGGNMPDKETLEGLIQLNENFFLTKSGLDFKPLVLGILENHSKHNLNQTHIVEIENAKYEMQATFIERKLRVSKFGDSLLDAIG